MRIWDLNKKLVHTWRQTREVSSAGTKSHPEGWTQQFSSHSSVRWPTESPKWKRHTEFRQTRVVEAPFLMPRPCNDSCRCTDAQQWEQPHPKSQSLILVLIPLVASSPLLFQDLNRREQSSGETNLSQCADDRHQLLQSVFRHFDAGAFSRVFLEERVYAGLQPGPRFLCDPRYVQSSFQHTLRLSALKSRIFLCQNKLPVNGITLHVFWLLNSGVLCSSVSSTK